MEQPWTTVSYILKNQEPFFGVSKKNVSLSVKNNLVTCKKNTNKFYYKEYFVQWLHECQTIYTKKEP